jgi:periplasmic divalent cation tolerance protein
MTIYLVSTFYPKLNEAKKIAKLVVRNKLAACVNINKNINSLYIWKSKMFDEIEIELNFKTSEKKLKKLISFLEKKHPYACPPIISFPIKKVNKKYLDWVKKQTK